MEKKKISASYSETTHLVLPNDTNTLGNLFGGRLLEWLDISCAVSASRHSKRTVATVAVNNVTFDRPIRLGEFVTIHAHVSRAFGTSMEIWADVFVEDRISDDRVKANSAMFTFVAIDNAARPVKVPEAIPETELELERYDSALRRRQLRLVLAGKMKPEDATELKALFS